MKNLMLNLNSHVKASRNPGSLQRLGRSVLLSDVPEMIMMMYLRNDHVVGDNGGNEDD